MRARTSSSTRRLRSAVLTGLAILMAAAAAPAADSLPGTKVGNEITIDHRPDRATLTLRSHQLMGQAISTLEAGRTPDGFPVLRVRSFRNETGEVHRLDSEIYWTDGFYYQKANRFNTGYRPEDPRGEQIGPFDSIEGGYHPPRCWTEHWANAQSNNLYCEIATRREAPTGDGPKPIARLRVWAWVPWREDGEVVSVDPPRMRFVVELLKTKREMVALAGVLSHDASAHVPCSGKEQAGSAEECGRPSPRPVNPFGPDYFFYGNTYAPVMACRTGTNYEIPTCDDWDFYPSPYPNRHLPILASLENFQQGILLWD